MQTVFRKEIKYIIPIEKMVQLEKDLEPLMKRDPNGENGIYKVRSQYYDSITNQDLRDNIDGVEEKRKIRLRVYSPEDEQVKLEYKCKSGTDGVKYSMVISRDEAKMMENHQYEFLLNHSEPLAHKLYCKMMRNLYMPKSIVEYNRLAFLHNVSNTRITFDYDIKGSSNAYGILEDEPFMVPLMDSDVGVLEVKYDDFLPSFLKEVLKQVDGLAEASSKYSKSRFVGM